LKDLEYWKLICHFMAKDGVVPDDLDLLARIFKQGARKVRQRLPDGCFIEIREGSRLPMIGVLA